MKNIADMFDLKLHMGIFENFYKITFRAEIEPFSMQGSKSDEILTWFGNMMNALKSSDASIMRTKLDCCFINYLTCSRNLHEDLFP